jgi:hypothetical protein
VTSTVAGPRPADTSDRIRETGAVGALGRLGLAARGALYLVVAVLALRIAFGDRADSADEDGALALVARQPFGKVLLVALAIGFAGYALWRLAEAFLDADEENEAKGWAKRALHLGRAVLYASLCWSAVTLLRDNWSDTGGATGSASARSGARGRSEDEWTARLLDAPFGRALVVVAALVVIGVGVYRGGRAFTGSWRKKLDLSGCSRRLERAITATAYAGLVARGVVFVLVGAFLLRAAWEYDPDEAVGVDGALRRLADATWGPALLVLVAVGLVAFGAYSFVEARFRRVDER